ncbi:MAG TPA: hypothetical protein VF230_13700, partial [Acidimicrobiales bacterium]
AFVRDHVLPKGRITGWTPDWYAGFPAYHFYFPLPTLAIILLDVVLPYGVAFKLVTVSGLVGLPVAVWAFGRLIRLPFPTPALMSLVTLLFVFDRYHTIWGGNAAATLAGEFSFSIALSLALLFLGVLFRALETGRGRALAAALFAATALSHLLPAAFAVGGAVLMLLLRLPDKARWKIVVTVGLVGFLLTAFWFLPFLMRHVQGYSNDMGWERTNEIVDNLLPWLRDGDASIRAQTRHLKITMPLALVGFVLGAVRRRRGAIWLGLVAASTALAFWRIQEGAIWNARVLPFWYLTTYLLAAVAIGEIALLLGEAMIAAFREDEDDPDEDLRVSAAVLAADVAPFDITPAPPPPPRRHRPIPNVPALLAPVFMFVVLIGTQATEMGAFATGRIDLPGNVYLPVPKRVPKTQSFVPAWAKWNYAGYERKPDYPEYRELVQTMARLGRENGCGRAMWEYEPELNRYGTPMALMLLPHWTNGCIGSMEGLYFESSASVAYHFLNQSELSRTPSRAMRDLPYRNLDVARGVEHLQLMGVRYYMATTPDAQAQAAANPDLRLVATTSSYKVTYGASQEDRAWQIYEVADAPIVAPLAFRPAVVERGAKGQDDWLAMSVDWYQNPSRWDVPLADGGPADWPRVDHAPAAKTAPRDAVRAVAVTDIDVDDDRIRFKVDRPGVPVVVRMSYFPNWKVRGAEGPWRVTPNFMVVVPTGEDVELRYGWTPIDALGWVLTLGGIALAIALARSKPVELPAPRQPPPRHEWVDPFLPPPPRADDEPVAPVMSPP